MKLLSATTASLMVTGTHALASAGAAEDGGMGLLTTFFIAFVTLVILFQFLPGLTLFLGILKGIFSSEADQQAKGAAKNNKTTP